MPLYATNYLFLFHKLFYVPFILYLLRHWNICIPCAWRLVTHGMYIHPHTIHLYYVGSFFFGKMLNYVGRFVIMIITLIRNRKSPKIKTTYEICLVLVTQLDINSTLSIPKRHYINRASCVWVCDASCMSLAVYGPCMNVLSVSITEIPNERRFGTHLIYRYE